MSNIVGLTALHYGKEYLYYAVKSVADVVDRHIILYTPTPSFGFQTDMVCPDTREELQACVSSFPHIEWIEGQWGNEWQHREAIGLYLDNRDEFLVTVDADEVWGEGALERCLEECTEYENRVAGFVHLWRSFDWACIDPLTPTRVINRRVERGGYKYPHATIFHFGYAVSVETMIYKWAIHGHKAELREGWMDRYIHWQKGQKDVHPANDNWWNPGHYDKEMMPEFMKGHPYWSLELIP